MRKFMILGVLLAAAVLLGAVSQFVTNSAAASSHREAPLISQDPAADNTDTYLFRSPEAQDTVTLVANYYPYEGAAGGPNFYRFGDDVRYEFNIDNNGDAKADIQYYFKFNTKISNNNTFLYNTGPVGSLNDANLTVKQYYTVWKKDSNGISKLFVGALTPPSNVGCHSFSTNWAHTIPAQTCNSTDGIANYEKIAQNAVYLLANGEGKVFAGQRRDSFFADVGSIFDLLSIRDTFSTGGYNLFDQFNVQTIALQVPISKLTAGEDPVIGFWATNSRKATRVLPGTPSNQPAVDTTEGFIQSKDWKQVSRLGLPLINEVVIPMALKDKFNSSSPKNDVANFAGPVTDPELAKLLNGIYGVPVPPAPRQDLVDALLLGVPGLNRPAGSPVPSDELRLNTSTAVCTSGCSTLGVIAGDNQGYPNGRRLTDDVIDISERVVAGVLVNGYNSSPNNALGDGVNAPSYSFSNTFPYLVTPIDGFSYGAQ